MKSYYPLLPVDHVHKGQAFSAMHLLQPTAPRIFILPLGTKSNCYLIGWHGLMRKGYAMSVAQPPLGLAILEDS